MEKLNDAQRATLEYWNAWIYEQDEDETVMSEYLVSQLGKKPLRILEAACGGGKLCVPLAKAGHHVTGIDQSESMLHHLRQKAATLPNLHVVQADMLTKSWGNGFDVVILGANLLVNIITERDSKRAQKNLLERAYDALKMGGRVFIDYDCPWEISRWQPATDEWICFEGTDDRNTYGRYIVVPGTANDRTRIITGSRRWEIIPAAGNPFTHTETNVQYFPPLEQICTWLYRIGFTVESVNGGYGGEPFDREHRRAVIWARKTVL